MKATKRTDSSSCRQNGGQKGQKGARGERFQTATGKWDLLGSATHHLRRRPRRHRPPCLRRRPFSVPSQDRTAQLKVRNERVTFFFPAFPFPLPLPLPLPLLAFPPA